MPTLYPLEEIYSNSSPIKATSEKGEKQEYSLSMYFHLYANLGNTYSNIGSFSCKTASHCRGVLTPSASMFLIISVDIACI